MSWNLLPQVERTVLTNTPYSWLPAGPLVWESLVHCGYFQQGFTWGEIMRRLGETASVISCRAVVAVLLTVVSMLLVSVPAQAAGRPGAPVPAAAAAASQAGLSGVSCSSADACTAVGTLLTGSPVLKGFSLAESWNGKSWTMKTTPNPKGATNSFLYGVSCRAASTCMAVGMYEDAAAPTGVPFAEAWNGTTWTVKTVPSPTGGSNSGLYGVSCASAHACVAVGNTIINGHNNLFSELWNGKTWTIKATPRPKGTTYSNLGDVSCRLVTSCTAVGEYQVNNSSTSRTLAEAWNGRTWAIEATPNPKVGVNGAGLSGVACSSLRLRRRGRLQQPEQPGADVGRGVERPDLDDQSHPQSQGRYWR